MDVNDVMEMIRGISIDQIAVSPALTFIGKFRAELLVVGFTVPQAETICSRLEVELPNEYFSDEQLQEIAAIYARIMSSTRTALITKGFVEPIEVILEFARKMSLKVTA